MASAPLNTAATPEAEDLFPRFPRVIYRQNPLEFVVCEFRFPAILKIELEVPAAFQEAIRKEYPLFQENTAVNLAPPELLQALSNANLMPTGKSYLFKSMDEKWQISLSRRSFSLTCVEYRRWDDFQKHLDLPLKALISCYEPQLFTRVGLRYRDLISRKRLNLTGVSWGELLDPGIVSFFHTPLAQTLLRSWQQVTLSLPRTDTQVTIQHGLVQTAPEGETCYVFDSDFSTESKTDPSAAIDLVRYFNRYSWSVFRSCISSRLHDAMEPDSA